MIEATPAAAARWLGPPKKGWPLRLAAVVAALAIVDVAFVFAAQDMRLAAGVMGILILALFYVRPVLGLALWFAAVPWLLPFRLETSGPAADASRIVGLMLITVALAYVLQGIRAPTARLAVPALLLAGLITLSTLIRSTYHAEDLSTYMDQILIPLGLAAPLLVLPLERRHLVALLGVVATTGIVAGGFGIYEHHILRNPWNQEVITEPLIRAQGPYPHPIIFAIMLGFAVLVLVETSLRGRSWPLRLAAVVGVCPVILGIFFTFSRGPLIAVAISVAFLFLRGRAIRWMKAEWLLLVGFVAVVARQMVGSEEAVARYSSSDTLQVRFLLYRLAWDLIEGNWLYGLGVAGFKHNVAELPEALPESLVTVDEGWQAIDNYFLAVLVEGGLLAGLSFFALIALSAAVARRTSPTDSLHRIGVSFMLLVAVVSLDIDTFHYAVITACFFLGLRLATCRPVDVQR